MYSLNLPTRPIFLSIDLAYFLSVRQSYLCVCLLNSRVSCLSVSFICLCYVRIMLDLSNVQWVRLEYFPKESAVCPSLPYPFVEFVYTLIRVTLQDLCPVQCHGFNICLSVCLTIKGVFTAFKYFQDNTEQPVRNYKARNKKTVTSIRIYSKMKNL